MLGVGVAGGLKCFKDAGADRGGVETQICGTRLEEDLRPASFARDSRGDEKAIVLTPANTDRWLSFGDQLELVRLSGFIAGH